MEFDRKKFSKGVSLDDIRKARKEAEKRVSNYSDGRAGFHAIEEGKNIFRILPPHDPETHLPFEPCHTTMLKCNVEKYKDGEPTGEFEVKNKKIFIATTHGNGITKDPVETYIAYVMELASYIDDKDEKKKFLSPITGWRGKDGWHPGIQPQMTYVFYALKGGSTGEIGRLEVRSNITKEMEKLSISEYADQPISTDIFSDPDFGCALIIDYDKDAKNWKDRYIVKKRDYDIRHWHDKGGEKAYRETERVPDEKLKELLSQEPLHTFYSNVYTMRDFNFALDGLRRFDEEQGYQIFRDENFLAELEEIKSMVPEEKQKEEKQTTGAQNRQEQSQSEESGGEMDVAKMSKPKLRIFLQNYLKENYGDDYQLPDADVKTYREWGVLALQGEDLPFIFDDVNDQSEESQEEEEKPEPTPTPVQTKRPTPPPVVKKPEVTQTEVTNGDKMKERIEALRRKRLGQSE